MSAVVQCKDCGFLAALQTQPQRQLIEADEEVRASGAPPGSNQFIAAGQSSLPVRVESKSWPICFARRTVLQKEFVELTTRKPGEPAPNDPVVYGSQYRRAYLEIISKDRECNCHFQWRQGFSPKEHQEMIDSESLRKDARVFQETQAAEARRHNYRSLMVALLGPVIALIATVVNVINANKPPPPITIQLPQQSTAVAPSKTP